MVRIQSSGLEVAMVVQNTSQISSKRFWTKIHFAILTNTIFKLDKYNFWFGQIQFLILSNTILKLWCWYRTLHRYLLPKREMSKFSPSHLEEFINTTQIGKSFACQFREYNMRIWSLANFDMDPQTCWSRSGSELIFSPGANVFQWLQGKDFLTGRKVKEE